MSSTVTVVGKKRKRFDPVEKDISIRLTRKLHHCLKDVRKCTKKAKAFETQRLVKKLKDLRKLGRIPQATSGNVNDLESQLESLKKIDPERIARIALSSKIRKDKKLSTHEALTSVFSSEAFSIPNEDAPGRHSKVESRLLSSKIIAVEVSLAVNGLKMILDPNLVPKLKTGSKMEDKDAEEDMDGKHTVKLLSDTSSPVLSSENNDGSSDPVEAVVVDEADDLVDDGGWESGSIHGGDEMQYDSEEDEPPADSEDDEFPTTPLKRSKRQPSSQSKLLSPKPTISTATSTFLPSLSVGYIKGSSDSDYESEDEKAPEGKKNRRGQRARQAIWEKKFGKNAKHVKKQHEEEAATVVARSLGKRQDHGWKGRDQGHAANLSQNISKQAKDRKAVDEQPTHPSWEAKRKLKEKESARILPPQGKKTVFAN